MRIKPCDPVISFMPQTVCGLEPVPNYSRIAAFWIISWRILGRFNSCFLSLQPCGSELPAATAKLIFNQHDSERKSKKSRNQSWNSLLTVAVQVFQDKFRSADTLRRSLIRYDNLFETGVIQWVRCMETSPERESVTRSTWRSFRCRLFQSILHGRALRVTDLTDPRWSLDILQPAP